MKEVGVPDALDGWTLEVIRALLVQGNFETDRFDFKVMLPRDNSGQLRLREAAAGFANASGGFLVFGIDDRRERAPADRLVGVEYTLDFPEHFGGIVSAIAPSIDWGHRGAPIRVAAERVVHVIHVPPSRRGPHGVLNRERWTFPKRTNRGAESMSLEEIRSAFVDRRSSVERLRLVDAEVVRIAKHAESINRDGNRTRGRDLVPSLYSELYHPQMLESALPFVLMEFTEHGASDRFQELLVATRASDALATQLSAAITAGVLDAVHAEGSSWQLSSLANRIMTSAHHFRGHLATVANCMGEQLRSR